MPKPAANPLRAAKPCRRCGSPIVIVRCAGRPVVLDLDAVEHAAFADASLPGMPAPAPWFGRRVFGYVDGWGIARMRIPSQEAPTPTAEENTYRRHDCAEHGGRYARG